MPEAQKAPTPLLAPPLLLDARQPRPGAGWFWYAVGFFLLVVFLSAYAQRSVPNGGQIVQMLSSLLMFGLMIAMGYFTWRAARAVQREQSQLEAIEELVQLRRW